MKRIIIHHSDLDGYTAGAIARLTYPECDTLSLGYDKPAAIPEAKALAEYDQVIVVDYALPPETMKALNDRGRLLWIDHHFSSIRRAAESGYADAPGLRSEENSEKLCGAELAWKYFVGGEIPRFLRLVGDYDTFRNSSKPEFQQEVLPFFYGSQLEMEKMLPANFHEPEYLLGAREQFLDDALTEKFISSGRLIQKYNQVYYGGLTEEYAFVREIWGLRVLCFNCAGHGSLNMQSAFDPEKHDAMMQYACNGRGWSYGIYTDPAAKPQVNLAEIAVMYGGGGHRTAAGFRTEKILPELE